MTRALSLVSGLLLVLAACSGATVEATSSDSTPTTETVPRVIAAERIGAPEGVRAWNVRYRSSTVSGDPTEVTGWVAIPDAPEGMPIVSWAHPTAGLGDECAPSMAGGRTPFHFADELEAGWAVIATDYEGLGGPGLHPYLVGESEARSIFDLARAAKELESGVGDRIVLWGFSQGGHASLSAAGLADDLAPELEVIGTVAVAPAVDLIGWPPAAIGTIEQGYIAAIVAGFAEAYHLDVAEVLTAEGIELLDEVTTRCADPTTWTVALRSGSSVFHTDPSTLEPWSGLLTENSPELRTIDSPVLLVLGDQDRLWDIDLLDVIQDRMCGASTPVAVSIHIGEDHLSVSGAARGTIFSFIQDRLDGEPFEPDC